MPIYRLYCAASGAAPDGPGGTGLVHHHPAQSGQARLQPLPDPVRQALAGGVVQTLDLVEVPVVKLLEQGLEGGFDVGEIHHPAGVRGRLAGDMDLDAEGVAMQAGALVALGHVRQPVRRLDGEDLEDVHAASLTGGGPVLRHPPPAHCPAAQGAVPVARTMKAPGKITYCVSSMRVPNGAEARSSITSAMSGA